jgi:uncharacterized protein (TIGR02145 family)
MKKNLLLMMLCMPVVLAAQNGNGVAVSGLAVDAGTVTFNVSWDKNNPSDMVWVFADYNDAGVMKRLPVTDATVSAGTVTKIPNNDKGVWVEGNAQDAGAFSTTVKLFTATADLAGACAYASNYPPVGEYTSATNISFTGTPKYEIVLERSDKSTYTVIVSNDESLLIPNGEAVMSFTDKTGAPGVLVPATYTLSGSDGCAEVGITLTLLGSQKGWKYQLYKGDTAVGGVMDGTGNALPFSDVSAAGNFNYTVWTVDNPTITAQRVMQVSNVHEITVNVAPMITSQPAGTTICVGTTVQLSVSASNAAAYQWRKNGANVTDGTGGTSTSYSTGALTDNATYTVEIGNASCSVTSSNATVFIKTEDCGVFQPQGSCTYTEPALVGTFASFDPSYSAATYVSLTDERDNKNYPVVKIGGRWIMARNLNYQEGLTWQANSNQPSTTSGQDLNLIGNFWCPGANGTTSSSQSNCNVWGALYSWETAMMLDGYGTWTEVGTYNTGAASATNSKFNQGRTAHSGNTTGGRGICPPNWHVPTDNEWGIVWDGMESGGGTAHQNAGTGWIGIDAGTRATSKCTCSSGNCDTDTDVTSWLSDGKQGTDVYGFRAIPLGDRQADGSGFGGRGHKSNFWSATAYDDAWAWYKGAFYASPGSFRWPDYRSFGMAIRCIRD